MINNATNFSPCSEFWIWSSNCEWSNQQTMIIELIIAGCMALILGFYFYKLERKRQQKREKYAIKRIIPLIVNIQNTAKKIDDFFTKKQTEPSHLEDTLFSNMIFEFRIFAEHLDNFVTSVSDDIDLELRDELIVLVHMVEAYSNLYEHAKRMEMKPDIYNIKGVLRKTQELIKKLEKIQPKGNN